MDREGMEHVQRLEPFEFEMYLKRTQNTICGRAPLLLFMHLLVLKKKNQPLLVWTHYDQSTRIQKDPSDHSVSYVSGYVVYFPFLPHAIHAL
ncbi:hypothetical protein HMI56_000430 [Coelomomyces lativittatus]|nr:hypothetical protein HMI56_000430 [Coelomomyces lativittatus]